MQIGRREIEILAAAALLVGTRLLADITSAAVYVYPDYDFGQSGFAFLLFLIALPIVFVFAMVRLYQRRFIEGAMLLALLYIPFSFNNFINSYYWKFRIHKAEYQAVVRSDPTPSPKYHVFDWGGRATQSLPAGSILEAIVYDETDEIVRPPESWSAEWVKRRAEEAAGSYWITHPPKSCRRYIESFEDHFYFVSEACG